MFLTRYCVLKSPILFSDFPRYKTFYVVSLILTDPQALCVTFRMQAEPTSASPFSFTEALNLIMYAYPDELPSSTHIHV
jgi:hypothetical protein